MKTKLMIFVLLLSFAFIALPTDTNVSAQRGHGKNWNRGYWDGNKHGRRRYQGRNRTYYGYKNYGQYRRTQVGNRRYRLVRRYYWDDGRRFTRWVRIYL